MWETSGKIPLVLFIQPAKANVQCGEYMDGELKGDNYKGVNYISFLVSKMTTLTIKILDLPLTVCITASQYYQLYREKLRLSMGYNQVWMKRFLVPRIIIFQINLIRDNVKPESACRYPPILAPNLQRHEMTTKKTWVITLIILFPQFFFDIKSVDEAAY